MGVVTTQIGLLTNAMYWIGKIYDSTFSFTSSSTSAVRRMTTKIPRTEDFREIDNWRRRVAKNINAIALESASLTTNAMDDPMYWIERRKPWR